MLKKYNWLLASLVLTGAIWFLTPASDPTWIKKQHLYRLTALPASPLALPLQTSQARPKYPLLFWFV